MYRIESLDEIFYTKHWERVVVGNSDDREGEETTLIVFQTCAGEWVILNAALVSIITFEVELV